MKCPQCPYYEQKTSYGSEMVKCDNKECIYKGVKRDERQSNKRCYEQHRE